MRRVLMLSIILSLVVVSQLSAAVDFKVGPQFSLLHSANDKYIDGTSFFATARLLKNTDLFANVAFHNWTSGVERSSPSRADEFVYERASYVLGIRYSFLSKSAVTPYIQTLVGQDNNKVEHRVTTYSNPPDSPPNYGLSEVDASTFNENDFNLGLGLGFTFPVIKDLYFDMNISAQPVYSSTNIIMNMGFCYQFGF